MDGGWFICTKKKLGRGMNRVGLAWLVTLSIDEVQLEINRVGESENTRKLKQIEKRKILQSCSQVR